MLSPIPSGWSRSVPPNNGDPCYVTTAIAIGYGSDATIASDAWSDPTVLVENGADGYSPTVTTGTSSDGSTTITVTNKDGSTTTELVDGTARTEAAKVATNFLNYDSTNGLIMGNKISGSWSGYRSQMLPTAFNILDASGNTMSSYGTVTTIGKTSGRHVYIDSDSLDIKNRTTVLATFSGNSLKCGSNFSVDKTGKIKSTSGTIGGFTITPSSIYSGTSSLISDTSGVYLGTDGIRTVGVDGSATHANYYSRYNNSNSDDYLNIGAGGIGLYNYIDANGNRISQDIDFYLDDTVEYSINHYGIYQPSGEAFLSFDNPIGIGVGKNLWFGGSYSVGTSDYPTGGHYLANNNSIVFKDSDSSALIRGISVSSSNNILIGKSESPQGGIYGYVPANQSISFFAGNNQEHYFGTYINADGDRVFRASPVYARTTSGGTAVRVGSTGVLYRYSSSSMRYKEEITTKLNDDLNPERLYDLNVWQYKYREGQLDKNDQRYGMTHIGLLAEDVKRHYPIAANFNDDGYVEDWSERYLIPPMLKLIQMQHEEIELIKDELKRIRDAEEKGENL